MSKSKKKVCKQTDKGATFSIDQVISYVNLPLPATKEVIRFVLENCNISDDCEVNLVDGCLNISYSQLKKELIISNPVTPQELMRVLAFFSSESGEDYIDIYGELTNMSDDKLKTFITTQTTVRYNNDDL